MVVGRFGASGSALPGPYIFGKIELMVWKLGVSTVATDDFMEVIFKCERGLSGNCRSGYGEY